MYSKLDALVEEEIVGDSLAIQYVLNQVRNARKTMHQDSQLTAPGGALVVAVLALIHCEWRRNNEIPTN